MILIFGRLLSYLFLAQVLCILFTAIINLWWQISAHMIGVGGLIGALLAISFFMQMPVFAALSGLSNCSWLYWFCAFTIKCSHA
jgi:hypothetical protein